MSKCQAWKLLYLSRHNIRILCMIRRLTSEKSFREFVEPLLHVYIYIYIASITSDSWRNREFRIYVSTRLFIRAKTNKDVKR